MSEHDEDQPPPGWRPPSDPTPPSPWASPGGGRPFPGEVQPEVPTTRLPRPRTVFAYPYPGGGLGSSPTEPNQPAYPDGTTAVPYSSPTSPPNPSPYPGSAPGYGGPPSYPVAGAAAAPHATSPTYPASPSYTDSPVYQQSPSYPDSPPYSDAPTYPGPYPPDGSRSPNYGDPSGYPGYADTAAYPGGGWYPGYGAAGPAGGWQPPPPGYSWGPPQPAWGPPPLATPPPRKSALAIIGVAILIAAVIGLAIGGQLVTRRTSNTRLPTVFPTQPSGGNGGAFSNGGLSTSQADAIAAAVDPSVVDINTKLQYQQAAAAGTGMVLTSDGQVLTNNHVIAGATTLRAMVVGGSSYAVKVLGTDPTEDVALIQLVGASGLKPIKTGDATKLQPGDPIVAVGNAGGVGGTPSVVTGTVEALDQSVTASDLGGGNSEQLSGLIQINAPLQPGDSGGPLLNARGQVVGMDTAASASNRVTSQTSIGFAIPVTKALSIAKEIAAGHASATIQIGLPGFLGVSVAPTNTGAVAGAPIIGLLPGSPAGKAGLAAGDVITSVDGQPVTTPKALTAILQQHHPGDKVAVGWTDPAGKSHSTSVTLITGPAA